MPGLPFQIPYAWKAKAARLVRIPIVNKLMIWSVRLVVPRHRVGVALAAIDDDGRILLLRHVFHPAAPWGLPGGWLDRGEQPAQGALRELLEETGLVAKLHSIVHVGHEPSPPHLEIAYLAAVQPGRLHLSGEILEAAWFPSDALPAPLLRSTQTIVRAAFQRHHDVRAGRWPNGRPYDQQTAVEPTHLSSVR